MIDRESQISAYADGELDPQAAGRVERQLATDPRARELVRIHQRTTALLRAACAPSFYRQETQQSEGALPHAAGGRTAMAAASLVAALGAMFRTFARKLLGDSVDSPRVPRQ